MSWYDKDIRQVKDDFNFCVNCLLKLCLRLSSEGVVTHGFDLSGCVSR